jgi:3-methyladenine DNA glycosylase/8-oxoguanine DNA glycosylase
MVIALTNFSSPTAASTPTAASPALDATTLAGIRTNLGWYRHGGGDPTTKLGPHEMLRAMFTPDGPATVRLTWGSGRLDVAAWGPGGVWAATSAIAMTAVGKVLDHPKGPHPLVRDAARRHSTLAAGASGDLYHALLPTIIEQRITAGEAVRQWMRLVYRLGEPAPGPFDGLLLPPRPERLASTPTWWFHPLGIEAKRARPLIEVARVAAHSSRLWDWALLPPDQVAAKLDLIRGVGPWTIGIVLGPVCGDDDAVAIGDYHFPHVVAWNLAGEPRGDDSRMVELLEPYRPQRGRVIRLLGLAGRRPPAFGPKRRILPMYRW